MASKLVKVNHKKIKTKEKFKKSPTLNIKLEHRMLYLKTKEKQQQKLQKIIGFFK